MKYKKGKIGGEEMKKGEKHMHKNMVYMLYYLRTMFKRPRK